MSASHHSRKAHAKFAAEDADILILSSDNVLFRLHSVNIRTHTTVFPIGDNLTPSSEPATFSEESSILEILFAHLYPSPPLPDLEELEVEIVQAVGCAAHKYGIASAMLIADLKMIAWAEEYPAEVASYALLHFGAGPRLDRAMIYSISIPLETAITLFTPKVFIAWLFHRDRWCNKVYGVTQQFPTVQNYALNARTSGAIANSAVVTYSECVRDVAALDIALLPPDAS
ncbi:hypothetical protein BDZ89DRAFT_1169708 [Hymenopellis radicata]|nr:hypothetical protein BDZ89DRAFT_1169708 [Hymenopellis radicata]